MTAKIPTHVLNFAGGDANLGVYKMFYDYFQHARALNGAKNAEYQKTSQTADGKTVEISFSEKEDKMNVALRKEIMRIAGISSTEGLPLESWATHPTLRWASFAVVSALVDMILPETMIDTIGMYTDVRSIGMGDSASFEIKPRDLFVVSKSGRAKRTTELHKQYNGLVTIVPEPRQLAVSVSLYRVLAGKESLAEFVMKAVRSLETQMTYDVYGVFAAAMESVSNTATTGLRVAGYSQSEFVRLSQAVTAWNSGAKAVAIGTQAALANVLPSDANYRYDLSSEYVKLGFIRNFQNTDIIVLPQVADYTTPFGLKLADNRIWFVSPSAQKLIKLVLEGSTLAYTDDPYKNANLMQNSSLIKSYGAGVATTSVAGVITLS